jgi:hypothetical protein
MPPFNLQKLAFYDVRGRLSECERRHIKNHPQFGWLNNKSIYFFICKHFALNIKIINFATTQLARLYGLVGYLLERTFTNVIFHSQISQI